MPREPVASDLLPALAAALAPVRDVARDGADEVLAHYPDLGDREVQSALERFLEQVADLLREVEASAVDLTAWLGAHTPPARATGSGREALANRGTHSEGAR
jgi:hypothetical protein